MLQDLNLVYFQAVYDLPLPYSSLSLSPSPPLPRGQSPASLWSLCNSLLRGGQLSFEVFFPYLDTAGSFCGILGTTGSVLFCFYEFSFVVYHRLDLTDTAPVSVC